MTDKIFPSITLIVIVSVIVFPTLGYFYGVLITNSFQLHILIDEQKAIQLALLQEISDEIDNQNKILEELNDLLEQQKSRQDKKYIGQLSNFPELKYYDALDEGN